MSVCCLWGTVLYVGPAETQAPTPSMPSVCLAACRHVLRWMPCWLLLLPTLLLPLLPLIALPLLPLPAAAHQVPAGRSRLPQLPRMLSAQQQGMRRAAPAVRSRQQAAAMPHRAAPIMTRQHMRPALTAAAPMGSRPPHAQPRPKPPKLAPCKPARTHHPMRPAPCFKEKHPWSLARPSRILKKALNPARCCLLHASTRCGPAETSLRVRVMAMSHATTRWGGSHDRCAVQIL